MKWIDWFYIMKIKQLKGFTILEALISLMLISIIMALTYQFVQFVGAQLYGFQKQNVEEIEYNVFNSTIHRDIAESVDYKLGDGELDLLYYDDSHLNYKFTDKGIFRQSQKSTDTFKLAVKYREVQLLSNDSLMVLKLKLDFLESEILTNYLLKKDLSKKINRLYAYED